MSFGQAVTQFEYRWHQKLGNTLLGALGTRWPLFSLEPDSIVAAAQRQTGMVDYGDKGCLEALKHLMQIAEKQSADSIGPCHDEKHLCESHAQPIVASALGNRRTISFWKSHPANFHCGFASKWAQFFRT